MIEDLKFSVMTSLTNENLNVEIYSFDTGITKIITLNDAIETYYKNPSVRIREINCEGDFDLGKLFLLKQEYTCIKFNGLENEIEMGKKDETDFFEAQIIVPYRNRKDQLHRFLTHIKSYMDIINIRFKVIIAEQYNDLPFNRGLLLNAAFLEQEKKRSNYIKYYIHHNCDLFPLDFNLDYSYTPINEVRDIYGYNGGIGGIAIFNRHAFKNVNGFPNNYWGWGAEDTTLHTRCINNNISIVRNNRYNIGIKEESHQTNDLFNHINMSKSSNDIPDINGLNTCEYIVSTIESEFTKKYENIVHYLIN